MSADLNPYVPAPEPAPAPPAPAQDPVWTLWDVLFTAILAFAAMVVIAMLLMLITGLRPQGDAFDPALIRAGLAAQTGAYALVVVYIYLLVVYHYRQPFLEGIRWRWPSSPAVWVLLGMLLSVTVMVTSAYLPQPRDLPIQRYFSEPSLAWLMVLFGTAVAPLVEEVFFRGFLYPALRRHIGIWFGIALTALSFAAVHGTQLKWAWAPLLMLFIVGVTLTLARERTGSVSAPFLLHLGYNATIFLLLVIGTRGFTETPPIAP